MLQIGSQCTLNERVVVVVVVGGGELPTCQITYALNLTTTKAKEPQCNANTKIVANYAHKRRFSNDRGA